MPRQLSHYNGYEDLVDSEIYIVIDYFTKKESFKDKFNALLLSDAPLLSKDMRRFIADVICGRAKPKARRTTTSRDIGVFRLVSILQNRGLPLTSNSKGAGAYAKVAERMGLSEDVVQRAYRHAVDADKLLSLYATTICDDGGRVVISDIYDVPD
jgi:hypothetical protein